jgi:alpha-D-xyloside xylohydrolase
MAGLTWTGKNIRTRIFELAENALRVTHIPISQPEFPPDRVWLSHVLLPQPEGNPGKVTLKAELINDRLQIRTQSGGEILSEASPLQFGKNNKLRLTFRITEGEKFYGWGEWFNAFARKQGKLHLRAHESLSAVQGFRTYSTIPVFLSSRGYGFFLLNSHESTWTIDPQRQVMQIEVKGPPADYIVIQGPAFKDILSTYTALTGRPPLLPIWAFGLWVTSYPQGHQDEVTAHARQHREREVPLDAVILDYHWEERFHNFQWRKELIPEPECLVKELKSLNIHLGLITTPFINNHNQPLKKILLQFLAKDIPKGMVFSDDRDREGYREAHQNGFFAHENASWWFGRGGMLDFTNPQACQWWNRRTQPLYDQGVEFFKNDDGEYLPDNAHSFLGMTGKEYHNLFGFFYGRAIYSDRLINNPDIRPLIYARSVWAGSQRHPAIFMGDQKPTFECIQRTMRAGLNLSMLGFAYWTADIFGLDGKTTPETHMRYSQWALFNPVARYFWRPPKIDDTRFPWSHNQQVEENFKKLAHLRYSLLPTYYTLARQAYETGLPILRPILLDFQQDQRFAEIFDQVMLGDQIMLAPVVDQGATSRKIILPAGTWHDFWSDKVWEGPSVIDYPAPLDVLPVLVRGSSILTLGEPLDYIPPGHTFDPLELHVYPPYPAQGWLYEDDGASSAYQQGYYLITRFEMIEKTGSLILKIQPDSGKLYKGLELRKVILVLNGCPSIRSVSGNGVPVNSWVYDKLSSFTIVRFEYSPRENQIIEIFI